MSRKKKNRITAGGNFPRPGQPYPTTIVLTQPKRFGIDIADYTKSIRAFENVDFSRRYKLYDLYSDILMDAHLSSVIDKRTLAVLSSNIEFRRNGSPDDSINEQLRSPWFRRMIKDLLDAKFWGFSLLQFYKDGEWVNYDLISRKHADPVKRIILKQQTDITGTPWDEYADMLFIGDKDDLGLLAKAAPWVIYKRNTTADWSQFSEVFGMPIREFIYETDDDEARQRCIDDAENTGSLAVLIHSAESKVNLLESGNKTGSAELYERLCERCNSEISKLILGNTLTTEASNTGTQALGTVHKKVEDKLAQSDRRYVLDVLNYEMTDILLAMGINTKGGEFCFTEPKDMDLAAKANILTQLHTTFNLPISDDYLYEEFGVEKPTDYKDLKAKQEQAQEPQQLPTPAKEDLKDELDGKGKQPTQEPTQKEKKNFANWLKGFFVQAPPDGAALDW
jgi:phage gp29-like protein